MGKGQTGTADTQAVVVAGFPGANHEIRAAWSRHTETQAALRHERRHVRRIDQLLTTLEQLHLTGHTRAPQALDEALSTLRELLPDDRPNGLRAGGSIARLMEELFEIQEPLLRRTSRGQPPPPSCHGLGPADRSFSRQTLVAARPQGRFTAC